MIVGAPLKGRVVIIDDVISAGTSVRESVKIIEAKQRISPPASLLLWIVWSAAARPMPQRPLQPFKM